MQFNADTPRSEATIQGLKFTIPEPFKAGHVCTEGEASSLNQTLRENVRNNVAAQIKAEEEKAEGERKTFTQEDVDAYVADYEFGIRAARGEARLSPEEREARNIARNIINAKLKESNTAKPDADTMEAWIKQVASQPPVVKEAARRVKSVSGIAIEGLDLTAQAA